jgi:hypothetical protein
MWLFLFVLPLRVLQEVFVLFRSLFGKYETLGLASGTGKVPKEMNRYLYIHMYVYSCITRCLFATR